jgi:hypothetical protein
VQHEQRWHRHDLERQVAEQPAQSRLGRRGRGLGDVIGQQVGHASAAQAAHHAEGRQVARDRGLGDLHALVGEVRHQVRLGMHATAGDESPDDVTPSV